MTVYLDSDDWVYAGGGNFDPYLADIKYLDAAVIEDNLWVEIGLDSQSNGLNNLIGEFRLDPSISVFIDTDSNPLTGSINLGTVRGAEYEVHIPQLLDPRGILGGNEPLFSSFYNLKNLTDDGGYETVWQGSVFSSVNNSLPRLEIVTFNIPIEQLDSQTNIDLYALAGSAVIPGVVNPFQRSNLSNFQGDRAPDYGAYNTETRDVVVRRPTQLQPAVLIDKDESETTQIGPDLSQVSLTPIEDQVEIKLEFAQELDVNDFGAGFGLSLVLDTDRSLSTGQIFMGDEIPTWGGDIKLQWNPASFFGYEEFHLDYEDYTSTFVAPFGLPTDTYPLPGGGPFGNSKMPLNDGIWDISGNTITFTFSASLLDPYIYTDLDPEVPRGEVEVERGQVGEGMLLSVQLLPAGDPNQSPLFDYAPTRNWVFDTETGTELAPLTFNPSEVQQVSDEQEGVALDLSDIAYQVIDDKLVVKASVQDWIPNDPNGVMFRIHIDTDLDSNTGVGVNNDFGNPLLGAEHTIEIKSFDDVFQAAYQLDFATAHTNSSGDSNFSSSRHEAWYKVNHSDEITTGGDLTVTIPLSELNLLDSELRMVVETGRVILDPLGVPTPVSYDLSPVIEVNVQEPDEPQPDEPEPDEPQPDEPQPDEPEPQPDEPEPDEPQPDEPEQPEPDEPEPQPDEPEPDEPDEPDKPEPDEPEPQPDEPQPDEPQPDEPQPDEPEPQPEPQPELDTNSEDVEPEPQLDTDSEQDDDSSEVPANLESEDESVPQPVPDPSPPSITDSHTVVGTNEHDDLMGTENRDVIKGFPGHDSLMGLESGDNLFGYDGHDLIMGNQGEDFIEGNGGNDTLHGGKNNDTLLGHAGHDVLFGELGSDYESGGEGDDWQNGNQGFDEIKGGNGNDTLFGGKNGDTLIGGRGNDLLSGDAGNDRLVGVEPNSQNPGEGEIDTLTGGVGADVFTLGDVFNPYYDDNNTEELGLDDYALIQDFNAEQDIIQLHGSQEDYRLDAAPEGLPGGAAVYRTVEVEDELIAIIQGTPFPALEEDYFSFV